MAAGELQLAMDPDDIDIHLRPVDEAVIRKLNEMPCTRQHLAAELDYSGEYIYQRVTRLVEHDIVEVIHDGFYRLAADGGTRVDEPAAADDHDDDPDPRDAPAPTRDESAVPDDTTIPAAAQALLEDWAPPQGDAERGRDLARQAVAALVTDGAMSAADLKAVVETELSDRVAWERNMQPALGDLRDAGLVDGGREGHATYHYWWVGGED